MIHTDREKNSAEVYFTYVNDVIGLFAIALAATSLQFELPAPFARLFLLIISLQMLSKQKCIEYTLLVISIDITDYWELFI